MKSIAGVLLLGVVIGGCVNQDRKQARGGDDFTDNWEQEQYANTNPHGDGSEGTAYYGAPGPSTPPETIRRAASPEAVPSRKSAAPRSAD